jgi:hypothetical protein
VAWRQERATRALQHTGDALLGYLSATTTAPMADLERVHRAPRHVPRVDHWVSTPAVIPGATTAGTRQKGARAG